MPPEPDVRSAPSTDSQDTPVASDSPPVTPGATETESDRPWKNVKAEMDRKFSQFGQQLADLTTLLTQQPARSAPVASQQREYTDEELLDLANAGNKEALALYIRRQGAQQYQNMFLQQAQQAGIIARLNKLYTAYPALRDPAHPLNQAAVAAKQALLQSGLPASYAVDLEAITTAIADNPVLAAEVATGVKPQVRESSRQQAIQTQAGVDGATHRRQPTAPKEGPKLSPEELALAKRMNIKDPTKAIKDFETRQLDRRSSVSLPLANYLNAAEANE